MSQKPPKKLQKGDQNQRKTNEKKSTRKHTEKEENIEAQSRLLQETWERGKSENIKNTLCFNGFSGFIALGREEDAMQDNRKIDTQNHEKKNKNQWKNDVETRVARRVSFF